MAHEFGTARHSHGGSANPRHLNHPPPNKYLSLSIRPSRALGGLTVLLALAVGLLLSSVLPVQAQEYSDAEPRRFARLVSWPVPTRT